MKLIILLSFMASSGWAKPESGIESFPRTPVTCVEVIELIKSATADGVLFDLDNFVITDTRDCPIRPHLENNRSRVQMIKAFRSCSIL